MYNIKTKDGTIFRTEDHFEGTARIIRVDCEEFVVSIDALIEFVLEYMKDNKEEEANVFIGDRKWS